MLLHVRLDLRNEINQREVEEEVEKAEEKEDKIGQRDIAEILAESVGVSAEKVAEAAE